jgi:hypothetical protein
MLTAQKESNDRTQMSQMNEFGLLLSARMQGGLSSVFSDGCGNVISVKRSGCGGSKLRMADAEKPGTRPGFFWLVRKLS